MSMLNGKNITTLLSQEELNVRIKELGAQITQDYAAHRDSLIVVAVLKGSVLFFADLCREIDLPLQMEFIGVSSYGDATTSSGVVQVTQDLSVQVLDKHVLLIEDIVETGLTTRFLIDNLKTRGAKSVKLCSLLEKPGKAKTEVNIDYLGFQIPDAFVIGYGLDLAQLYRNLPFVGMLPS